MVIRDIIIFSLILLFLVVVAAVALFLLVLVCLLLFLRLLLQVTAFKDASSLKFWTLASHYSFFSTERHYFLYRMSQNRRR